MGQAEIGRDEGVQFDLFDGRRSSQATGKRVFARAAGAVDSSLASRIENQGDWRKRYLGPVRELVEAGARSPKDALRIAGEGLAAAHEHFVFVRDGQQTRLSDALVDEAPSAFRTEEVTGEGLPSKQVTIPYRGGELVGDGLLDQLGRWEEAGIIERSCGDAIRLVAATPEWLDLTDTRVVLLGAASEMGPLEWLCTWGADVIAIDLPRPELWDRIISVARKGTGVVRVPVRDRNS